MGSRRNLYSRYFEQDHSGKYSREAVAPKLGRVCEDAELVEARPSDKSGQKIFSSDPKVNKSNRLCRD
jgi:hypothetical protein